MATNIVFNGVTYSVPAANEEGWQSLSNYLIALAGASVSGGSQSLAVRIAGTATVTAATSDAVILINFAGAVTVNLPAGVDKQILWIGDISGAAETNNITINRAGTNTIFGGTSYTLNQNNQVACFIFSVANGNWNRIAESKLPANGAAATLLKSDGTKLLYAKLVDADVATAAAIARSKVASGTANHVVINDGTGVLSSEAQLAVSRGGTGLSALGSPFQSLRVNAGGTALEYTSVGGGDVTGPASAVNNGVVLFNGTTGKILKDSAILSTDLVLITGNQTIGGTKTFSSGAVISAITNQLVLGTTNTVTITSPAPAASRVHTIPDVISANFVMSEGAQSVNGAKTFASSVTINPTTNQLVFGVTNTTTITSPAPAASRVYTIPDAGGAASFVMTAGTQTIAGTLTLPATVNYTSAGSIVKSGVGALTITNASAAGLTFAGTGTVSAPTGTYTLAGLSLGNVFTVAQTISATTNQIILGVTNTTTINSAAPAASRTYNIIDAGGAADFVMTAGSQTLTSKTLTAPILSTHVDYTNIATPATPGAGVLRVYSKSDSRLYRVDSTGLEVAIGGGLDPVERSTALNPAVVGTLYVCNTSAGGFTITLPTGSSKASIGFLDARETFATNNLTIAPATGQAIDGQAVNETLVLDVSGSWVILTWSVADSRWVIQSSAPGSSNQAIVQNGNTLGAAMTIGTNDNFGLNFETNGTTKIAIGTAGDSTIGPASNSSLNHQFNGASVTILNHNGGGRIDLINNGNGSNLAVDTQISTIQFSGRFNSATNDLAGIRGYYRGNGTTRTGSLDLYTYNAGSVVTALSLAADGALTAGPSGGAKFTINGHMQIARLDVATSGNIDYTLGTGGGLHFNSASAKTLQAVNGDGTDGRMIYITNTSGTLTIKDTSAAVGTANGRIITGSGADLVLTGDGAVTMVYNAADNRWRVLSVIN